MKYLLISFIVILLIFIFYLLFKNINSKPLHKTVLQMKMEAKNLNVENKVIPKIIWSFWDSENIPPVVQKCFDSWKLYNPDFEIHILNKNNIHEFVSKDFDVFSMRHNKISIQKATDFLRLYLIYNYGGFWLDATIFLNDSLNKLLYQNDCKIIGFYIHSFTTRKEYPIIENWFFASVPKNTCIKLWLDCFLLLNHFEISEGYIVWVKSYNVDLQNIPIILLSYLTMHAAAQFLFQVLLTPEQIANHFCLYKAEDGPFLYLVKANWKSEDAFENMDYLRMPIVKLRGDDRKTLEKNPELLDRFQSL